MTATATSVRRVLVVDDTREVRALLRMALDGSGAFTVVAEAGDGQEAVIQAEAHRPDLVLLDLAMPVMDGLEAIPLIRQRSPGSRIVVLSGFNTEPMASLALARGADAYLEKRYGPDELIRQLYAVCHAGAAGPEPDAEEPEVEEPDPGEPSGEAPPREAPPRVEPSREEPSGDGPKTPGSLSEEPIPVASGVRGRMLRLGPAPTPQPMEEQVRRSRQRFRLAFDHAPIGMALIDAGGHFLMVNDALVRMTRRSREELLGQGIDDLSHGQAEAAEGLLAQLDTGEIPSYTVERQYPRPDGSQGWMLCSRSALWDADGRPSEYVLHVTDITEAKLIEQELRHSSSVLTNALDGIALIDADECFVEVNPAFARMVGREPRALIGTHWATTVHPEDRARVAEAEAGLVDQGRVVVEARGMRSDGSTFGMEVLAVASEDGTGRGDGRHWFVRDISERQHSALELRKYAEELARANADLVDFAAMAAHDLRAPLQVIGGFASLLNELYSVQLDDRGREFLEWILRGTKNMAMLIDDLLGYARVGAAQLEVGPVDLAQVLTDVITNLDLLGDERRPAPAEVTWDDDLPTVVGDASQLGLLMQNLISNSCKFVAEGIKPRIHVGGQPQADGWLLIVDDNGIGIDPRHRERVFAMFERVGPRDHYDGTGVGLAICKRIVERTGGRIWITDNPAGSGTRFCISLPQGDVDRLPRARSVEVEAAGGPEILLVDDNDGDAEMVRTTLAMSGTAPSGVRQASSLAEAHAALTSMDPACVLLDLTLPDTTGLEAVRELRVAAPSVPIVVLTSRDDKALALAAVQEGAQDYLVKGRLDAESLARAVSYAVERSRLDADLTAMALHDPLTRLPNRSLVLERLAVALARMRRTADPVAVLYIDLDGFKEVNDRLGHAAGDQMLVEAGRRLQRAIRPEDTAGRIGGDEFVVVCDSLRGAAGADVDRIARRVADAIRGPVELAEGTEVLQASVGVAMALSATEEPEALLQRADQAMYAQKRGR